MSAAVDIGPLLDDGRWTAYQKFLTALAALAVIFDGFDIQILGFAIPSLMKEWHMSRAAFGPVLAFGLAGMTVGSPLAGWWGDRLGRRNALIGCMLIFSLATLASAFVDSVAALAVLRFITGIGTGGVVPNASALTAEFAPLRRRPVAVKLTVVCIPIGGMLGGIIAAQVLPAFGWRLLYVAGGTLPLVFAALLWTLMPESPRFLVQHSADWPKLGRFMDRMGCAVPAGSAFSDSRERRVGGGAPVRELFSPALRRDTIGLWIAFLFCLGGIYLVFGWLPAMLTAQGAGLATSSQGLASYNSGGVLGVFMWALLMNALGSRGPLLSGALAAAGSALAILLVPLQSNASATLMLAALGLNGLLSNAVQTSMYALAAHVYPTAVRASGIAYASGVGRAGGIVASMYGTALIGMGPGAYWRALAASMIVAFAGLAYVRSHFPAIKKESAHE